MNQEAMIEHVEIQVEAEEVAHSYCQRVPQPKELLSMYRPMKFRKLKGREHQIKKVYGDCWDVASFRHALLFGVQPLKVNFGKRIAFHELVGPRGSDANGEDNGKGLLTSDKPIEIYSQYIAFHKMRGNVLVGGLGLGLAAEMILRLPEVESVTVVEINKNLIKLIGPQVDMRFDIVNANLFDYLKQPMTFDSAYFDIWYGTGEMTWTDTVVPLYRLARKAGINDLGAWGEHEMRGQLITALYMRTRMEEKFANWKPYKVFIEGAKKVFGTAPPWNGEYKSDVVELIKLYIEQVGSPEWEETFEWEER